HQTHIHPLSLHAALPIYQFAQSHPDLGFKKLDTHRSPVIGPRLIGSSNDGRAQAVLTIISLNETYLAKKTRIAVDRIMDWLQARSEEHTSELQSRGHLLC